MTTHSPVALRELSGNQLFVLRETGDKHEVFSVGTEDDVQSTIRLFPDAFLATSVIVCEGASEVGLIRGIDQHRTAQGEVSISARGVALVDCGGGEPDKPFKRASIFRRLGYRAAVLRDDDMKPSDGIESTFIDLDGSVFSWREGRALEDELFMSLTDGAVGEMLHLAAEIHGDTFIDDHIKSVSANAQDFDSTDSEILLGELSLETRAILGKASRTRKSGWFKSVSWMEKVAGEIVAPNLAVADAGFREIVGRIFDWAVRA